MNERPPGCASNPIIIFPLTESTRTDLVSVLKALADDTRLEVFRLIAGQTEPLCVCDIVDRFSVGQSTISHHLKVLRDAGLITVSRQANWAFYQTDPHAFDLIRKHLQVLVPNLASIR